MIQCPVIKAKYHVETLPGEGIFLLSENEKHVLEGETMFRLVPLLDGTRSWEQILALLGPWLGYDAVRGGIEVLTRNGHVEEAALFPPRPFQAYWGELGLSPAQVAALMQSTNIHVVGLNADTGTVLRGLQASGFRVQPTAPCSLLIAVVDDYQNRGLEAINRQSLALGRPWILLKPHGLMTLVGPFFRPGRTACWACLESRLRHNREAEIYVQRRLGRHDPFPLSKACVPLGETQAVSLALLQMVRWLARGENPHFESRLVSLDVVTGEQRSHFVMRRPQCPACGNPAYASVAGYPIAFEDRQMQAPNENGMRSEEPEATFNRYGHHISEITGVVKNVLPAAFHGAGPLRSYVAGHNFALKTNALYFLKDGLRVNSSGKGRSDAQARTSALCEALERYCGLFRGEEERRLAAFSRLNGEAVDPRTIMQFSDKQYRERDQWLARGTRFQIVPLPFDPDATISWSPVWSWTERRRKLLPTSLLYYGFEDADGAFYCWADSNGAAAGSYLEDAALQGGLELVERDAVALWWANRLRRPAIDLGSLNDPYIDELHRFYAGRNRKFWVLDLTADLGVPAAAAISHRVNGPSQDIIIGFGAHFDPRIAISRALTEMNQFMPAVLAVGEDGQTQYSFGDPETVNWWRTATVENQPYLVPADGAPRSIKDLPAAPHGNLTAQLLELFGRMEAKGMEILLHDQTRPDIGLPVVRVIVPGMRHFWARYAPGRLYDVPVEMGWLKAPTPEADLNPVAMFV
jgi:ribosomal protein S12 methylthiotransferase accessory factor